MIISISQCRSGNRCKQWRDCPDCAKIRQAKIADIAERGSLQSPYLTYAVVKPLNDSTYTEEKKNLLKAVSKIADGGLWTVETGKNSGLHTNLVIGSSEPFQIETIYESLGVESSVFVNTKLDHSEVRNVASYSSKQDAMPSKDAYTGNLYGRFGTFKNPLGIASSQKQNPELALMAIEQMLIDKSVEVPKPKSIGKEEAEKLGMNMMERINHNKEEAQRVRLKALEIENDNAVFKHTQRSLAVLAGEIELRGLAYHPRLGVVGKRELRQYGIIDIT